MKKAFAPEEISILFLEYLNAGNLDGVVSLFEPNAVIATGSQSFARGTNEIRTYFEQLISHNPQFEKVYHEPPIINGDIALTSTRVPKAFITVEVCRKQGDGSWLWLIDPPSVFAEI